MKTISRTIAIAVPDEDAPTDRDLINLFNKVVEEQGDNVRVYEIAYSNYEIRNVNGNPYPPTPKLPIAGENVSFNDYKAVWDVWQAKEDEWMDKAFKALTMLHNVTIRGNR